MIPNQAIHIEEIFTGKLREENQKMIERNGCDGLFAQPIGICVEWDTFIVVAITAKKLKIVVSSKGLNEYLHQSLYIIFVFC